MGRGGVTREAMSTVVSVGGVQRAALQPLQKTQTEDAEKIQFSSGLPARGGCCPGAGYNRL